MKDSPYEVVKDPNPTVTETTGETAPADHLYPGDIPTGVVFMAKGAKGPVFLTNHSGKYFTNVLLPTGRVEVSEFYSDSYYHRKNITWPENAPPLRPTKLVQRTFKIEGLSVNQLELLRHAVGKCNNGEVVCDWPQRDSVLTALNTAINLNGFRNTANT